MGWDGMGWDGVVLRGVVEDEMGWVGLGALMWDGMMGSFLGE
jgi:hypothetical protein